MSSRVLAAAALRNFALSSASSTGGPALAPRTLCGAAASHAAAAAREGSPPSQAQGAAPAAGGATVPDPQVQLHQGLRKEAVFSSFASREWAKELSSYDPQYLESIQPIHKPPKNLTEKLAYGAIQATRLTFDTVTGYRGDRPQSETQWLRRMIFLETVAGVPGMCAGMLRHLRSLRTMKHDQGWIMTLLEEAENERMHLLTFMEMRKPGPLFRAMVMLAQGVYFNVFFVSYLVAPRFCHALVGYLEEEAVKTYTHAIQDIDAGHLWNGKPAPDIGKEYWKLSPDASMRDLVLAIRADEACHSHVNHSLAQIKPDDKCPFVAEH